MLTVKFVFLEQKFLWIELKFSISKFSDMILIVVSIKAKFYRILKNKEEEHLPKFETHRVQLLTPF